MRFSKWLLLNNIIALVYHRADTFVVGRLAGAQPLGFYSLAYEIANLTTESLIAPARRAIFPGYAMLRSDLEKLRESFLDVLGLVLLIGAPTSLGVGLVAEPLVRVVLGEQWIGSIPLIQILAIYGFLAVLGIGSGPVYLATGRPHYLAWILGGGAALMVPLLIVGTSRWGESGAAGAVTTSAGVAVLADFFLVSRLLRLNIYDFLRTIWRPITAVALMTVSVRLMQFGLPASASTIGWAIVLFALIAIGAVVYMTLGYALWRLSGRPKGAEQQVFDTISDGFSRLFGGQSPRK